MNTQEIPPVIAWQLNELLQFHKDKKNIPLYSVPSERYTEEQIKDVPALGVVKAFKEKLNLSNKELEIRYAMLYKYGYAEKGLNHISAIKLTTEGEIFITNGGYKKIKAPILQEDKKPQFQTLLDMWMGTTEQYNIVINSLKNEYGPISASFITDVNGQLIWNKHPKKGFAQYIKGFLYTCIQKGWVEKNKYSANQFKVSLKNTFNIIVNHEPFKDMHTPPLEMYRKPFKNMPKNLNSQNS